MKSVHKNGGAFTLVELIVVVTILAILGTIGFVSYSSYLGGVRDANRVSQLAAISDGLHLYSTTKTLPLPDNYVTIDSGGEDIAYQGYAGVSVLETIAYSKKGVDPKDKIFFSYYLTADKKFHQLMAFLEESTNLQVFNTLTNRAHAATDYSTRYPTVYGKKLGILTDASNTPIQELTFTNDEVLLSTTNATDSYIARLSDSQKLENTGLELAGPLKTIKENGAHFGEPKGNCPEGFIPVPGSLEFGQPGFCVAKYEMSYDSATAPNSILGGTDWNSYAYDAAKTPVSKAGLYPIADINQLEAITACNSIGAHLITNHEWMTIARNIEAKPDNWTGGEVGNGFVYNGISNNGTYGCNIDLTSTTGRRWVSLTGDSNCIKNSKNANKLTLSNGEEIWDLAGNIQELVNRSNNIYAAIASEVHGDGDLCGASNYWHINGNPSTTCAEKYGPMNNAGGSNLGFGDMTNNAGTSTAFIRGGHASNGAHTGLYNLRLTWVATSKTRYAGFRCAK